MDLSVVLQKSYYSSYNQIIVNLGQLVSNHCVFFCSVSVSCWNLMNSLGFFFPSFCNSGFTGHSSNALIETTPKATKNVVENKELVILLDVQALIYMVIMLLNMEEISQGEKTKKNIFYPF